MEVFGFHDIDDNLFTEEDYSFTETYYDSQNVLNILGWFPILGSVIGCIRIGSTIIMYLGDNESHRAYHRTYFTVSIVRGVVEFCSMGWVFVIPDLLVKCVTRRKFNFKEWRERKRDERIQRKLQKKVISS